MATKTQKTAPKAAAPAKPASTLVDLKDLVARHGGNLAVWQKAVPFDHSHIAATSLCLVLTTPEGQRATYVQLYNGMASPKQVEHLNNLEGGRLVGADHGDQMAKKGYNLATARKRGGKAK